ncbi:hypothetical protein BC937DRAFT_87925 [Endogone sp. FLAS-F59071]|nr:hypothetical protein BC937DRAFT_87925 [Endogone sp. FLAS-F59071]|eukprot:RUS19152.1 hypothetical protein BC937DRAFT_87925 [Endogone sp. FLAS-F59071]
MLRACFHLVLTFSFAGYVLDIIICPLSASGFHIVFRCGYFDDQGNLLWYGNNSCPHTSLVEPLPSISVDCYLIHPENITLNATNTNYYLGMNFTDLSTGKVINDTTFLASAMFFDPSSSPKVGLDPSSPFYQDLFQTQVLINPTLGINFAFNQIQWSYLTPVGDWISKFGLPFAPRYTAGLYRLAVPRQSFIWHLQRDFNLYSQDDEGEQPADSYYDCGVHPGISWRPLWGLFHTTKVMKDVWEPYHLRAAQNTALVSMSDGIGADGPEILMRLVRLEQLLQDQYLEVPAVEKSDSSRLEKEQYSLQMNK